MAVSLHVVGAFQGYGLNLAVRFASVGGFESGNFPGFTPRVTRNGCWKYPEEEGLNLPGG